jgi:hypothetical protein
MVETTNNTKYRNAVLKILRYSNKVAIIMILVTIYVCFMENVIPYITMLIVSSIYLGWATSQYIVSESDQCQWHMRSLQYDCQIASFNSRLSIVSNLFISVFGLGFSVLLAKSFIGEGSPMSFVTDQSSTVGTIMGLFKMMVMYIIADKIHTSQMIISILYKYSQSLRHLTLEIEGETPDHRYPLIFLDGARISDSRYVVTSSDGLVGVTFTPSLSLANNSIIEYVFVEEDAKRTIRNSSICNESDRITCLFRCRAVVKKLNDIPNYTEVKRTV